MPRGVYERKKKEVIPKEKKPIGRPPKKDRKKKMYFGPLDTVPPTYTNRASMIDAINHHMVKYYGVNKIDKHTLDMYGVTKPVKHVVEKDKKYGFDISKNRKLLDVQREISALTGELYKIKKDFPYVKDADKKEQLKNEFNRINDRLQEVKQEHVAKSNTPTVKGVQKVTKKFTIDKDFIKEQENQIEKNKKLIEDIHNKQKILENIEFKNAQKGEIVRNKKLINDLKNKEKILDNMRFNNTQKAQLVSNKKLMNKINEDLAFVNNSKLAKRSDLKDKEMAIEGAKALVRVKAFDDVKKELKARHQLKGMINTATNYDIVKKDLIDTFKNKKKLQKQMDTLKHVNAFEGVKNELKAKNELNKMLNTVKDYNVVKKDIANAVARRTARMEGNVLRKKHRHFDNIAHEINQSKKMRHFDKLKGDIDSANVKRKTILHFNKLKDDIKGANIERKKIAHFNNLKGDIDNANINRKKLIHFSKLEKDIADANEERKKMAHFQKLGTEIEEANKIRHFNKIGKEIGLNKELRSVEKEIKDIKGTLQNYDKVKSELVKVVNDKDLKFRKDLKNALKKREGEKYFNQKSTIAAIKKLESKPKRIENELFTELKNKKINKENTMKAIKKIESKRIPPIANVLAKELKKRKSESYFNDKATVNAIKKVDDVREAYRKKTLELQKKLKSTQPKIGKADLLNKVKKELKQKEGEKYFNRKYTMEAINKLESKLKPHSINKILLPALKKREKEKYFIDKATMTAISKLNK